MATANKGYNDQTTGSNPGTWGQVLNDEALDYIDQNLGGITSKALTNVNVTLTTDESRNAILRLTGTLTGAVQITTSCIGFFFVENLCTGNFAVTVRNNLVATAATVLKSTRQVVISDATNGCRLGVSMEFPSSTVMTFRQSSAPTGWTKDTVNFNNSAFRSVTGSVSNGGSLDFTSAFASRTITVGMLPDHSIGISDPGHSHTYIKPNQSTRSLSSGGSTIQLTQSTVSTDPSFTGISASFGSTQRGGAQSGFDFTVKYVDLIIATKDAT